MTAAAFPEAVRPLDPGALDPLATLAEADLFAGTEPAALADLAAAFEWGLVPGGTLLVREGEPGTSLYVVAAGKLRVLRAGPDGTEVCLREVGRGGNVGEMSLLTGAPRSASVLAARSTVVGALSRERFEALLRRHPEAALALNRMLATWIAARAHSSRSSTAPPPTTVAVISNDTGAPLAAFARGLTDALGRIGPARTVTADDVDAALGAGTAAAADPAAAGALSAWMHQQEAAHRYVVYVASGDGAGPEDPAWARRCMRQADRVVTLVRPDGPRPRAHRAGAAREVLAVLHPDTASAPRNTARLGPEAFDRVHHVRAGRDADFDRLARHLAGGAVCLVLGGGGARAFAHIGVVAALREAGVPIDAIGGTSMGAVVGALCALELDASEMLERSRLWAQHRPHTDYTAPVVALLSGRRGRAMLREMFGATRIEDLWTPYFAVSTDLTAGAPVLHREGPLAHWLRASIAIPGVVPPLAAPPDRLLVDGGVLENIPVGSMRGLYDGPVVAVDVSAQAEFSLDAWGGEVPGAFAVLRDRARSWRGRAAPPRAFPSLYQILARASTLASDHNTAAARGAATLYLEPPVRGFDLFGWNDLDRIARAGYDYARAALAEAPALTPPTHA